MGDAVDVKVNAKRGQDGPFSFGTGLVNQLVVDAATGFVLDIEDTHFNTNRSVVLPEPSNVDGSTPVLDERRVTGLGVLHAALVHAEKNSSQRLFVTGHTDPSGTAAYNQALSEKRAENATLLLRGEREKWRKLSNKEDNVDDIQSILKWQNARAGWDCDPGPVNNKMNGRTRTAIGRFQERYNQEVDAAAEAGKDSPFKKKIGVDKKVGEETWGAFYDVYMTELMDLLELEEFSKLEERQKDLEAPDGLPDFVGCGEHIPFDPALRITPEDGNEERKEGLVRDRSDRRVELLFFDPGEQVKLECHPKPGQCKPQVCPLYKKQEFTFEPIEIPKGLELMEANLRLTFVDPEGKVRPFPEGVEVELKFGDPKDFVPEIPEPEIISLEDFLGDGTEVPPPPPPPPPGPGPDGEDTVDQEPNVKTGPGGTLRFVIPRKAKTCFLRFAPGEERAFVSADAKDLQDQKLVTLVEAMDSVKNGRGFFGLPREFTTLDGFWTAAEGVKFDEGMFLEIDDRATKIGSRDAPAELKLEVRWQFFRFEYFDRWTSSTTSVPQAKTASGAATGTPQTLTLFGRTEQFQGSPHATSAWSIGKGAQVVHCLAWLHRPKDEDGNFRDVPDEKSFSHLTLGPNVFVRTEGDGKSPDAERALLKLDAAPSADVNRLRFYDLPTRWTSTDYPVRFAGEGVDKLQPFQKLDPKKSALAKPYLVSLDIIVLANSSGKGPLNSAAWDDKDNRYGLYDSQLRLYKPDETSGETYFTEHAKLKKKPEGAIVFEFPAHTRLVARGEDLFEVFDGRTSEFEGVQGFPLGARAGRPYPVGNFNGFAMKSSSLYDLVKPNGSTGKDGRFGQGMAALLRFCGHDGGVELFSVLQYCVVFFDFKPPENKKDGHKPMKTAPDPLTTTRDCLKLAADRWNGRPVLYHVGKPEKARGKWKAVFVRGGPSTGKKRIIQISVFGKMGSTAFMWMDPSTNDPIGSWEIKHLKPDPAQNDRFTGAHELGHSLGMPDEYFDRRDEPSLNQANIREIMRSPGTPYGFDTDGMMIQERKIRTRYFWHLACWFREDNEHFDGLDDIVVEHGPQKFSAKMTPRKGNAVQYPTVSETNVFVGKKPLGFLDRFLYVTGRDGWTEKELGGAPFDGLIAVRVKMAFSFTNTKDFATQSSLLSRAKRAIDDAFNFDKTVVTTGKFDGKTVRLRLLFSPRFISRTFPEGKGADKYLAGLDPKLTKKEDYDERVNKHAGPSEGGQGNPGVHANVRVASDGKPGVRPDGNPREALVRSDSNSNFDEDIVRVFGELVGLPEDGDEPSEFRAAVTAIQGLEITKMEFA